MENCKQTEWILETIDHLRKRKARPDLGRICHLLKRRHGLSEEETETKLEKLVDAEIVMKVEYKGNTSYRNAAKWRKSLLSCAIMNSTFISSKILEAILSVSEKNSSAQVRTNDSIKEEEISQDSETRETALKIGATYSVINAWLQKNCEGFDNLKSPMVVVIQREVEAGRIRRMENGHYVITPDQMDSIFIRGKKIKLLRSIKKADTATSLSKPGLACSDDNLKTNGNHDATGLPRLTNGQSGGKQLVVVGPPPSKRGRPPKNRGDKLSPSISSAVCLSSAESTVNNNSQQIKPKRPQSCKGLDSEIAKKTAKVSRTRSLHSVCDFCNGNSNINSAGETEPLLCCKDCTSCGHPSCMNYSRSLAARALRGPWQCMNCKTCCMCDDAGKPNQMLFCDGCDRGYHMDCHQPAILKKPAGKWECSNCQLEDQFLEQGLEKSLNRVPCDFIPAFPPLTFLDPQSETCYPDASNWSVDEVVNYFGAEGFTEEAKTFKDQEIDGVALLLLKRADVLRGLELKLGPALKINRLIQALQSARKDV